MNARPAALAGASMALALVVGCSAGCSDSPRRLNSDGATDLRGDGAPSIAPSDAPVELSADAPPLVPEDAATPETEPDATAPETRPPIEKTGLPLPDGVVPPRRLLGAEAELAGAGRTKCTHQEPPSGSGERWCAFSRPTSDRNFAELWVINVTLASTGQIPVCDGTDPACLKLTGTLDMTSANAFDGDTLIFYTDSTTDPAGDFVGPVSAWRPGWTQGRTLTSEQGVFCRGHNSTAAAACLSKSTADPQIADGGELRAGLLEDEAGGLLPAVIGAAAPAPLVIDRTTEWQMGFSADGETFALTVTDVGTTVSRMLVVATRDIATTSPHEIVSDIQFWTLPDDAQKVFFARTTPTDASLHMADFPAGGGVTLLTSRLRSYILVGAPPQQGLAYLTKLGSGDGSAFHLLTDRADPASALTVFSHQGGLEGVLVSPDLRYTVWLDEEFRGQVVRHAGLSTCLLNLDDRRHVFLPMFLQSAGLLFWTEPAQDDDSRRDAFWAAPESCREQQRFAQGIEFYNAVGDRGIILGDEKDPFDTVTLKYAAIGGGGTAWPADGPVRVQERVKAPITLIGSQPLLLIFRVVGDGQQEGGIYLFGPVPF